MIKPMVIRRKQIKGLEKQVKADIEKVKRVGKSILSKMYDNKGKILKKVVKAGGKMAAAKVKKIVEQKVKKAVIQGKTKLKKIKNVIYK